MSAVASNIFGTFNYLAVRRIGKQVHTSVKTMYLGIVGLLIAIISILFMRPSYFKFWKLQYFSGEQVAASVMISLLICCSQMSLNKTLEEIKAPNVASFTFLGVVVYYFGLKSYHYVKHQKDNLTHIHGT